MTGGESRLWSRLRLWSRRSWQHGTRVADTRQTLELLAALAAATEGREMRAVPDVGEHGLADQLAVLSADARRVGVPDEQVDAAVSDLSRRLGLS